MKAGTGSYNDNSLQELLLEAVEEAIIEKEYFIEDVVNTLRRLADDLEANGI